MRCLVASVVVSLLCLVGSTKADISFAENGYSDVVVAISPDVHSANQEESKAVIDGIKVNYK